MLVLSPTRELASQIADSFRAYGRHLDLTVAVVFGGVKYGPQIRALAGGVDILVATPGRLLDHLGEKLANLAGVETLVLDEADQMLDLGFLPPIRRIVAQLPQAPAERCSSPPPWLGRSASSPRPCSSARRGSTSRRRRRPVETIDQRILFVEADRKRAVLADLFADPR